MKKLNYLLVFALSLVLLVNMVQVSAFFPKSHMIFTINGFNEVSSPITEKCKPYLNLVIDGDDASDVGVLHYGSSNTQLIGSYIYPHTRGGYQTCLMEAGADVQKQCFCYGNALHIIQDAISHNEGGITQVTLKKYAGSNYFGHMTVERNFENKQLEILTNANDYAIASGQLDYFNKIYLDSLFDETNGNSDFLKLMSDTAGIDMTADAKIIRSGYQGEGFYSTAYKDKVSLPWWAWGLGIAFTIVGLGMFIIIVFLGKSRWKWASAILWLITGIIGAIILVSFITGTTWKLTTLIIEIPPKFGYLSVSNEQINTYNALAQQATNDFLETGVLTLDDASGLTYYNRDGTLVKGVLTKAETPFKIVWYGIILPLYLVLNIWLLYKSFKTKKNLKR